MPLDVKKESVILFDRGETLKGANKVEVKLDLNTDQIEKILSVSASSNILDKQMLNGKIKYKGKVTFFICYINIGGEVNKREVSTEFMGELESDKLTESTKSLLSSQVEKVETDATGVKLSLISTILVTAETTEEKEAIFALADDNLVCKKCESTFPISLGVKESVYTLEDEFELDFPIKDVISQRAEGVVTSCECGVGCITVMGEVYVNQIFLTGDDGKTVRRKDTKLPFRVEVECDMVISSFTAVGRVKVKAFKTDIAVDFDKNTTDVACSITLSVWAEALAIKTVEHLEDCYSIDYLVNLKKNTTNYKISEAEISKSATISGVSVVSELPVGATYLTCNDEKLEISSIKKVENGLDIEGVYSLCGFFKEGDNVFTRKMETAVNFNLFLDQDFDGYQAYAIVINPCVKILSLTETEIKGEVIISLYPIKEHNVECVCEVEEVGEKGKNSSGISVYIPLKDEELWSLAKRLNVTPEELILTNPELQFPLTDKERIVIYRQKA